MVELVFACMIGLCARAWKKFPMLRTYIADLFKTAIIQERVVYNHGQSKRRQDWIVWLHLTQGKSVLLISVWYLRPGSLIFNPAGFVYEIIASLRYAVLVNFICVTERRGGGFT